MIQIKLNVQAQPYISRGKKCVTYTKIISGSNSDNFQSTLPSSKDKQNTQNTSKKSSTPNKLQQ